MAVRLAAKVLSGRKDLQKTVLSGGKDLLLRPNEKEARRHDDYATFSGLEQASAHCGG